MSARTAVAGFFDLKVFCLDCAADEGTHHRFVIDDEQAPAKSARANRRLRPYAPPEPRKRYNKFWGFHPT